MNRRTILCLLWCVFLIFQFTSAAAAAVNPAPYEQALLKTGQWETAYWGDEGRMAYRFTGGWEKADDKAAEASFTIDKPTLLRTIVSVHANTVDEDEAVTLQEVINGETSDEALLPQEITGQVRVIGEDGEYGPFDCVSGSPAVLNGVIQDTVLWVADTDEILLEPGTYTLEEDSPETAALDRSGRPIVLVKGVGAEAWREYQGGAESEEGYQGSYNLTVLDEFGESFIQDGSLAIADKGDAVGITFMVADSMIDQNFDITQREDNLIEARSDFSVLPDQGIFELSVRLRLERSQDDWSLSGTASVAVNGTDHYEAALNGTRTSEDMPGFFFPQAAAGVGSLGNIPGPANEVEAAAGVVAPGLLALLASLLAGGRGQGGGSPLVPPEGFQAPSPGGFAPPSPEGFPVPPSPESFTGPKPGSFPSHSTHSFAPSSPENIPPTAWNHNAHSSGVSSLEQPIPHAPHPLHSASGADGPSIHMDDQSAVRPASIDIAVEKGTLRAESDSAGLFDSRMGNDAGAAIPLPLVPGSHQARSTGNGFFKTIGEKMKASAMQPLQEASPISPDIMGVLTDRQEKIRLTGKIEGLLKAHRLTDASGLPEEARSRLEALSRDVLDGKKDMIQASREFGEMRNLFEGRNGAASTLKASLQPSADQASGVATISSFNEFGKQLAGDVASGALSEIGFNGEDMIHMTSGGAEGSGGFVHSAVQVAMGDLGGDVSEKLSRQGVDILNPMFKPRAHVPYDLIETLGSVNTEQETRG